MPSVQLSNKELIVIGGPTAVGKTKLTVDLAKQLNTVIVSCDSRQFYKEMAIGTAKPTSEEMNGVQHHFIDSHSIHDGVYTAGKYEADVSKLLKTLFKQKDRVILTGGSGLYMHAVIHGIDNIPNARPGIKPELLKRLEKEGLESLQNQLRSLDPSYFEKADVKNPVRVVRALEVCLSTGRTFSSFLNNSKKKVNEFKVKGIVLNRDREELYKRINLRVDIMVEMGLFEEAQSLYSLKDHPALKTVGYSEIFKFMDGIYTKEEAIHYIKQNSRRYAKRQLTWFRREESFEWMHPDNFLLD